jgi:asparagine synthase (glutamine-hydrolysing)
MCGIAGIYYFKKQKIVDPALIKKMGDVLIHRGPDGEGQFINKHVGLAHRRLSIIDLASGSQPMFNESNNISIVFNGEIYNYKEIRSKLIGKGHSFKTNSDTESIIHLYEEMGVDCVQKLQGMFAFAIWDQKKQLLFMARDRLGIKPLYYCTQNGTMWFASEIKSILQDPTVHRELNIKSISDYLSFLYFPAPSTAFKGIYKLPPGHRIICKKDSFKMDKYWDVPLTSSTPNLSENAYIHEIFNLLQKAVTDRLMTEVPLGAFLSAGVDSSSIVALMKQSMQEPVNTCTVGFKESVFDESIFARQRAMFFNTTHHEYFVKTDILRTLDKIIWHLDEPFADASAVPTYYLCKMAKQHVTVALAGDGGDELFGGYINYSRAMMINTLKKIFPTSSISMLFETLIKKLPHTMRGRTFLSNLITSEQRGYFDRWTYFKEDMKNQLLTDDLKDIVKRHDSFAILEPYFSSCANKDILSQLQYVDLKTYLADDILTKVDKMSMAHSLEVRVPFLDHRVVEFVSSVPTNMKFVGNNTKYLLKKCMKHLLPKEVLTQTKHGFLLPIGEWFRNDLKEFTQDILFDSKTRERGYFNINYVQRLWVQHLQNEKKTIDLSLHLWSLLVFELWHRRYLDGQFS